MDRPTDVIVNQQDNSLIIADWGNWRVVQWFNQTHQEILIENIVCHSVKMDKYGFVYVSDFVKHEVRRWKMGAVKGKQGTLVAGGNGRGNQQKQLDNPTFMFVDDEQSLYVSEWGNNRVMKWKKDARYGIILAGGYGKGNTLKQLNEPNALFVDHSGQIYVADSENNRIMRWSEEKNEVEVIVGGNGEGDEPNQLHNPIGLSFDLEENLYVSDYFNHRIQKFDWIS